MDGWLKTLIASACVVVIAGGGYYAWSEYSANKERDSLIARQAASTGCLDRLSDIAEGRMSADDTLVLEKCAVNGFVTADDINHAYERAKEARQ